MIVLLSKDRITQRYYTDMLQAHTEGELVKHMSLSLLDESKKNILTERDGRPIERITILAHTGDGLFAGKPPEFLASCLIKHLERMDAHEENASRQIKEIDIIGCDNGRVSETGEGFTVDVARRMLAAGYSIKINALTNLSHPRPYPCAEIFSTIGDISRARPHSSLIRTKEDLETYERYENKLDKELHPRRQQLLSDREEMREEVKRINIELLKIGGSLSNGEKKLELDKSKDKYMERIKAIDCDIQSITEACYQTIAVANALCETLATTTNLRHYLDTDPQCDFTSRVLYELGPRRGRSSFLYKAARSGDIAALSEQIRRTPFLIDIPNDKGLTPLFAAAHDGQLAAVKTLLDAGADADLAPTMLLGELLSSIKPESREIAVTLLEGKYGKLTADMVVQLNPLDIAKIMKHEDVEFLLDCHEHHQLPMHQAVGTMRHGTLVALCDLDSKALNQKNDKGLTPLFLAATHGDWESARILINHGALANIPIQVSPHTLFETLSPEAISRATTLLHERFASPAPHDTVNLTAADIAHINGYEDLSLRLNSCVVKQAAMAIPMPVSELQTSIRTKAATKIQSFRSAIAYIKAEGPKEHAEHEAHEEGEEGEETEGRSEASEKHSS